MSARRNFLLASLLSLTMSLPRRLLAAPSAPALMLARVYRSGIPLEEYWLSEKYDGVRAYWDGQQFWTRSGKSIIAPKWFSAALPSMALDGELWAGRGRFSDALSTIRSQTINDDAWRKMRYMIFDLPSAPDSFDKRKQALEKLFKPIAANWLVPVKFDRVSTHQALQVLLERTVRNGGEGLMLHRGSSLYHAGRNADLLKVKLHQEALAMVVDYLPGRGRHVGKLGALLVELPNGKRFKLGSGFSDADRNNPPSKGSWVFYRHNGHTSKGLPRFARFIRVQAQEEN